MVYHEENVKTQQKFMNCDIFEYIACNLSYPFVKRESEREKNEIIIFILVSSVILILTFMPCHI